MPIVYREVIILATWRAVRTVPPPPRPIARLQSAVVVFVLVFLDGEV